MTFEKKTVSFDGRELSYWVAGSGEPLLYVHPAGGVMITAFLETLAKVRTVYVPVIPGFDGTPAMAGVERPAQVADLLARFAGTVIGGEADVMGVSFGGWVALWLALNHPALVRLLVLEAPAGLRFGMDADSLSPEAARANLFLHPEKAESIRPTRERAIANGAAFAGYTAGVYVDEALRARVDEIAAPTLVLMATRDVTIPAETGRFLAAAIPQCNVTYIYHAAHALEVDQPAAAFAALKPFLARGPAFLVNRVEDAEAA